MELDAKTKLRRFCFLGSLEPVYVHLRGTLNVAVFLPKLQELCKALDDVSFLIILKDVLQDGILIRRDEPLFAYATYLATDLDEKFKLTVRQACSALLRSDEDLFIFCKYAALIQKEQKRKGLSRTVHKAITAWYEAQPAEAVRNMFLIRRGEHGFTHKWLIKQCHINDETIGAVDVASIFFKTCTELIKESESKELVPQKTDIKNTEVALKKSTASAKEEAVVATSENTKVAATKETAATTEKLKAVSTEEPVAIASETALEKPTVSADEPETPTTSEEPVTITTEPSGEKQAVTAVEPKKPIIDPINDSSKLPKNNTIDLSPVVAISKLRTTKNKAEALKIIRKYKLHFNQVPSHLLRYAPIMEALVPTMSYLQLLKFWRNLARFNHFENPRILKLCQTMLDNKKMLHKGNIHPIVFLMQMHELGIRGELSQFAPRKVEAMKMAYFRQLYVQSFGQNQGTGLRMHITINLQANYKKKLLKNHKKLSFYDASVALAFGYFKKESNVDVFHWVEEKMKLEQVPWTKDMDIHAAISCCDKIVNAKNVQRLVTPVLQSLPRKQIYDVFVAIVPTAGRGNPKKNSEFLAKFMDKYREVKNPKAKYVIVDLLKFKKSMRYSDTRNENILEICGLDEHTTDLITNFVLNRFG